MLFIKRLFLHIPCIRFLSLILHREEVAAFVCLDHHTTKQLLYLYLQSFEKGWVPLETNPTTQQRKLLCTWCWTEKHPGKPYPNRTASLCALHRAELIRIRAESRQREKVAV